MGFAFWAEQFPDQRFVAGIVKFRIKVFLDEIEKGRKKGKSATFCVGFASFRYPIEKLQHMILCDRCKIHLPIIMAKSV